MDEVRRDRACSELRLTKDFLYHQNILNFLYCTNWDKDFPDFTSSLEQISPESWNYFLGPFDEIFFSNWELRDQFFALVNTYSEKGVLDDVERLTSSIARNNPIVLISRLLGDESSHESILSAMEVLYLLHDDYQEMFNFQSYMLEVAKDSLPAMHQMLKDLLVNEEFQEYRILFFDAIAKSFETGVGRFGRTLFPKMLMTQMESGEAFFFEWFNSEFMDTERFFNISMYFANNNAIDFELARVAARFKNAPFQCQYDDGKSSIVIDMTEKIDEIFEKLVLLNHRDFLEHLLDSLLLIELATPMCPIYSNFKTQLFDYKKQKFYTISTPISTVANSFFEFASDSMAHDILRLVSSIENETQKDGDGYFLLEVANSEVFYYFIKMLGLVHAHGPELVDESFEVQRRLTSEFYFQFGSFVERLGEKISDTHAKKIAKLWSVLRKDEKKVILNIFDDLILYTNNLYGLLDFYHDVLNDSLEGNLKYIKKIIGNVQQRQSTLEHLSTLSSVFKDQDVLNDMERLFSQKYFLNIIQILSRGSLVPPNEGRGLAGIRPGGQNNLRPTSFVPNLNLGDPVMRELFQCGLTISGYNGDTSLLIRDIKSICPHLQAASFVFELMGLFSSLSDSFDDLLYELGIPSSPGTIIGKDLFFSGSSFFESTNNLLVIDELFQVGGKKGLSDFLKLLSFYIFDSRISPTIKSLVNSTLMKLVDTFGGNTPENLAFRARFFQHLYAENNYKNTIELTRKSVQLFQEFEDWRINRIKNTYAENEEFSCRQFSNLNVGGSVCPDRDKFAANIKRILELLIRENTDAPHTAIGYLMRGSSLEGLAIPFEGNASDQRIQRLGLAETILMNFDFTNRYDFLNEKIIDYDNGNGPRPQRLSTAERLEVVVREVWFDDNYLGAHFMNSIARTKNYQNDVAIRKNMMQLCTSVSFCGNTLNAEKRRMARNSIEAYDALWDAGVFFPWRDYMMALQSVIVASSNPKSTKDNLLEIRIGGVTIPIPHTPTQSELREHNSEIIFRLAEIGGFHSLGRLVHDRIGDLRPKILEFIEREDVQMVDRYMMYGHDLDMSERIAREIIALSLGEKNAKGQTLIDFLISTYWDLPYQRQREVENLIGKILSLSAHIGDPTNVFEGRFAHNSTFDLFKNLPTLLKSWPNLAVLLDELLKTENKHLYSFILDVVDFLYEKAYFRSETDQNFIVEWLNHSHQLLAPIAYSQDQGFNLFDLIGQFLEGDGPFELLNIATQVLELRDYLNDRGELSEWLTFIQAFLAHPDIHMADTARILRSSYDEDAIIYDLPRYLLLLAIAPSVHGGEKSKWFSAFEMLLKDSLENLTEFFDRILPSLSRHSAEQDAPTQHF